MSQYLEEAAEELRKAVKSANRMLVPADEIAARERIAKGFAQLAAIEKGLIPQEIVGDLIGAAVRRAREESGGWAR